MYAEHNTGETELYDLDTDPFELRNVTDDDGYEAVRAQLAERLAALKTCAGSSCLAQSGP
jgi:hypothetical protein